MFPLLEYLPRVSLDAAGLVALADLTTIAKRTALAGTASWLDLLILCPGLHRQQTAVELNKGEYPATAALTTGYVFRVENQATVHFLQNIGRTGCVITLSVENRARAKLPSRHSELTRKAMEMFISLLTVLSLITLILAEDWWGLTVFLMLITSRFLNIVVTKRRSFHSGWKGMSEPGVYGDLLILLSQDRWIRMQGLVDDLKSVTSGQWLRDQTFVEDIAIAIATLLVYLAAAFAGNATQLGKVILTLLLLISVGLLAVSNKLVAVLNMRDCVIRQHGEPRAYKRRLDLAEELIKETGREDWAIKLGMIVPKEKTGTSRGRGGKEALHFQGEVTM